ncbi:hypothetical protein ACFPOH_06570 [Ureibacillus suwonensis]|uniref:Uncharacterized protein n=1 Tax=Ureibacillus suwonensis TaxID=313007 RepID=A0ABW0RA32_9BACL
MGINCECGVPTVQGEHLSERGCALSKHVKYLYGRVEGLSEQAVTLSEQADTLSEQAG